jgi:DNA mismatch repair protein MutS
LREDSPPLARDGGFIADAFNPELDRLRAVGRDGQRWLAEYQAAEAARTAIPSLKVGYNSVFGYYIEVTHTHRDKVPSDYVRKQTVRNAERYITDALKRFETDSLSAQERALQLELQLFDELRARAAADIAALQRAASAIATIDVLAGLAELSMQRDYCRPEIIESAVQNPKSKIQNCILEISDGRHLVLEQTLAERFVPNDCQLAPDADRLLIITGPNMAGKSTYIRQVALLTLLAQTGSWVPAKSMRFAPADRIFARVGAADELARGQSTFMVEMIETARILNNATPASLVILDEIGRGTSTFDGLALAWAITEHLAARIGCRTLFATHYHELTELASSRKGVANFNVAVREQKQPGGGHDVVFLHRIVRGATDKSYGIHVARMAGIPPSVVARSTEVLAELEQSFAAESKRVGGGDDPAQGALFPPTPPPPAWWQALADELTRIDLDRTTPIDALALIRDVQARLRQ